MLGPFRACAAGGLTCGLLCASALADAVPSIACTAVAAPGPVYAGGIAEPVSDIVLTCEPESSVTTAPSSGLRVSVSVSLNTSVTNAIGPDSDSDVSDAVLVVNGNDCPAPVRSGSTFGSCGAPSDSVQDPQFGRLASVSTLEWTDVTIPFPGSGLGGGSETLSTLRIRGIRANAAQLGLAGGARLGLPVTANVRVRSDAAIVVWNGTLRVAYPTPELRVGLIGDPSSAACSGDGQGRVSIHLREGFASAFRSGSPDDDEVQSTRVMLEFEDVPDGIAVSVPAAVTCHQPRFDGSGSEAPDALALGLVSGHDPDGVGGTASLGAVGSEPTEPVELLSGRGRAVYEVQSQDSSRVEDCHISVSFDAGAQLPAQAKAKVSASLAPRSTVLVASSEESGPRFAKPPRGVQAEVDFAPCGTTLLYPFVTNQAGFTTSLVITHGSRQALAGRIQGQAGSCDLHYYGADSEGGPILLVQHSTVIEPGEQLVLTLSDGDPERNILGIEQFQGYLMAVCGFPEARGYAFITDGFGGIADLAMGYLAPLVPIGPNGKRVVLGGDPE